MPVLWLFNLRRAARPDRRVVANEEEENTMDDEHPEARCDRCERPNPVWWTPAELWKAVEIDHGFNGVLCPSCFIDDAEAHGITAPQGTPGWLVSCSADVEGDTMDDLDADLIAVLNALAEEEGGPMFMGRPERWWEANLRRCENGHVSRSVLKSEALSRDACLACRAPVHLTFPEDEDGALLDASQPGVRSADRGMSAIRPVEDTTMDDQLIPTLAMTRDPRLRRLFALVGRSLDEGSIENEWDYEDVLFDLAPEYLPPEDTDDPDLREEWESFVANALDPRRRQRCVEPRCDEQAPL